MTLAAQSGSWSEGYSYDRYGNRAVTTRTSPLPGLTGETPTLTSVYNAATNRIGGSFVYDAAGNITSVPGRSAAYDAENRQISTVNVNSVNSTYGYDGDSRRVSKTVGGVTTTFVYDATGQLAAEYGPPITTSYEYDNLGRPKKVTESGVGLSRETNTTYDDLNLAVTTSTSDRPGENLVSTTHVDPLGRPRLIQDGVDVKVQKAYRYGDHVSYELTSNPYISTSEGTMGWTVVTRDSVGRPISTKTYAGATLPGGLTDPPVNVPTAWGSNTSTTGTAAIAYDQVTSGCAGPTVKITDEASNERINCPDGLGRLVAVTEPNSTVTNYTYDVFDNLIGVKMGGQPNNTCTIASVGQDRCFTYSTLSRMMTSVNPEGGPVSFTYFDDGTLHTRSQSSNVVATMTYDKLDRLKTKSYSVSSPTAATPTVTFAYDTDFKGALSSVSSSISSSVYSTTYTHDGLGRVKTMITTQPETGGCPPTPASLV